MTREVTLTILTGAHAGQSRSASQVAATGVAPADLLVDLGRRDVWWEISWPAVMSGPAVAEWAVADLVGRVLRAALHGRPVRVLGILWEFPRDPKDPRFAQIVGDLEDLVVESDRDFTVVTDDETGLLIGSREHGKG